MVALTKALAAATVVLAIATVALIWATLSARPEGGTQSMTDATEATDETANIDSGQVDLWDRDSVLAELDRTRSRIGPAAKQSVESRGRLQKALESHDQVAIKMAQFEHDRHVLVLQEFMNQRAFLVSQLQHLVSVDATAEANRHAKALKRATWALVLFTIMLSVVTIVGAFIARS